MMAQLPRALAAGLLALLTTACQPWASTHDLRAGKPAAEVLYASQHCGRSEATPRATWIGNARQLKASLQRIHPSLPGSKPVDAPALDFQHEIALLVEMGQRPTLGYRLALSDRSSLHVSQGRARLTLQWHQPPADAIVAQALSSPCLLLKLDRGDYRMVQILDQKGAVRASAAP